MTSTFKRIALTLAALAALLCFSGCFERFTQKKAADPHAGETAEEHAAHSHAGETPEEHAGHSGADGHHEGETPEEHAAHAGEGEHHEGDGHDHSADGGSGAGEEAGK